MSRVRFERLPQEDEVDQQQEAVEMSNVDDGHGNPYTGPSSNINENVGGENNNENNNEEEDRDSESDIEAGRDPLEGEVIQGGEMAWARRHPRSQRSRTVMMLAVVISTLFIWKSLVTMQQLPYCQIYTPLKTTPLVPHIHSHKLLLLNVSGQGEAGERENWYVSIWAETEATEVQQCVQNQYGHDRKEWWSETEFSGVLSYQIYIGNSPGSHPRTLHSIGKEGNHGRPMLHANGHYFINDATSVWDEVSNSITPLLSITRYDNTGKASSPTKPARHSIYKVIRKCEYTESHISINHEEGCVSLKWVRDVDAPAKFYPLSPSPSSSSFSEHARTYGTGVIIASSAPDCRSGYSKHTPSSLYIFKEGHIHSSISISDGLDGHKCPPVIQAVYGRKNGRIYSHIGRQQKESHLEDISDGDMKWRYVDREGIFPNYNFKLCGVEGSVVTAPKSEDVVEVGCNAIPWTSIDGKKDLKTGDIHPPLVRVVATSNEGEGQRERESILLYTGTHESQSCRWFHFDDEGNTQAVEGGISHLCSTCGMPGSVCHHTASSNDGSMASSVFAVPLVHYDSLSPSFLSSSSLSLSLHTFHFPLFTGAKRLKSAESTRTVLTFPTTPRDVSKWNTLIEERDIHQYYALSLSTDLYRSAVESNGKKKAPVIWQYDTVEDPSLSLSDQRTIYRLLIAELDGADGSYDRPLVAVRYHSPVH